MKMTVRGIIFFGIYIFLITLPLDTALLSNPSRVPKPFIVKIAVGAGFVGFIYSHLSLDPHFHLW